MSASLREIPSFDNAQGFLEYIENTVVAGNADFVYLASVIKEEKNRTLLTTALNESESETVLATVGNLPFPPRDENKNNFLKEFIKLTYSYLSPEYKGNLQSFFRNQSGIEKDAASAFKTAITELPAVGSSPLSPGGIGMSFLSPKSAHK